MRLYFAPFACSMASRAALYEAGISADFSQTDIFRKRLEDGSDYRCVNPRGTVPAMELNDGRRLMDGIAILEFIADSAPETKLAPPAGTYERYQMQSWLSYIASDLHKGIIWFLVAPHPPQEAKAFARAQAPEKLEYLELAIKETGYLVGSDFTIADMYLGWALGLFRHLEISLEPYPALTDFLERYLSRPSVSRARREEMTLLEN